MDPIWKLRQEEVPAPANDDARPSVHGADGTVSNQNPVIPPPLIAKLLAARGFREAAAIEKLLYPKFSELHDPFLLKDMDRVVDRLAKAFLAGEKVCIYADFDLDGTSGLALLWTGMKQLGFPEVLRYQPKRLSEGYGFHLEAVEDLHRQGVSVIITVDVGITALAACEKAAELGVDVLLTDHHLPGERLPKAFAIVNPNRPQDESGLGFLCGAGVAFYLLRALKKTFHDRDDLPSADVDLKSLLDFFAIATLTDMVPLVEDNRVLVKNGLAVLAETKRPGLRALLEALELTGRPLTSQDVAIRFAPKLNALSRMEAGVLPIDLFLCDDAVEARRLVKHVLANNSTRVQLQSDAESKAQDMLKDWAHDEFVFVHSEDFHRGVVGLIATKLAQNFNRPAFVGSLDPDEGTVTGSARVPPGSETCLVEALGSAAESLTRFGGHSAAAGFELHRPHIQVFIDSLSAHFKALKEKPRPVEFTYDLDVNLPDVGAGLMKWYDFVGPFGTGFQVPLFRFSGVRVLAKRDLKGGHVKLQISPLEGVGSWDALLFSPSTRQKEIVESGAALLDVLGELQWNYFAGNRSIQILVKDLKVRSWQ